MTECGFWWASVERREPQVVEVSESHGIKFVFATGNDVDLSEADVRLIERVLPAGRAAAAVDRLDEIAGELWPWRVVEEISAILLIEESGA
ncbi:hypothetical protein MKK50_15790 [Methylobacterium sp. J-043]|jgi:hypothetical protein|uniref:Uncharacterized protein n=1 Tax=Methylobacterium goesingense TaxID=243690 RepID=A0ABV2L8A0_9HYPH|nr:MULTISPECIES: hypothetical protein [Methylobacteriaceae]MCJ2030834.1 hypothetical protein [Methylobacterium sp. J-043]KQP04889.1 hypothetical protein ASF28_18860 [Methylobacterium sp. Leaf99]KQT49071.1 hypothetical protein ASG52_08820 [Methylobacterium sp. Leaf456]UYW33836.1 hypothetical protein OKB92_07075 [Methylorubrum extorquens]GJD74521.1 hypothetical protein CFIICLFH_2755 [Methylobacterium goesingense]